MNNNNNNNYGSVEQNGRPQYSNGNGNGGGRYQQHQQQRDPSSKYLAMNSTLSSNNEMPIDALLPDPEASSPLDKLELAEPPRQRYRWFLVIFLIGFLLLTAKRFRFPSPFHKSNAAASNTGPTTKTNSVKYDYIVVGGGPSGILCATTLARKLPDQRVLLLESGTASQSSVLTTLRNPNKDIPLDWTKKNLHLNKFDIPLMWSGVASASGRHDGSPSPHHWPLTSMLLARALGGCGLVNAMIYVRSLPHDFSRWNVTGWSWETMLPYYQALERYVDDVYDVPSIYRNRKNLVNSTNTRGRHGPIVTMPSGGTAVDAVAPLFVESAMAAGWPLSSRGFNDPSHRVGAGFYDFNVRNGVRHSVAEALLGGWNTVGQNEEHREHLMPPKNLHILTGATVQKVIFATPSSSSSTPPRALGIEYYSKARPNLSRRVLLHDTVQGEVILACGTIMTPQVLANSGISERGSLVNLRGVGKNLQDHPVVGLAFPLDSDLAKEASSVYTVASEMEEYFVAVETLKNRETAFARNLTTPTNIEPREQDISEVFKRLGTFGTAGFSAGAFLTSPWADPKVPDIQLTVFPRVVEPHILSNAKGTAISKACMLVTVALLVPEARSEVVPYQLNIPVGADKQVRMEPEKRKNRKHDFRSKNMNMNDEHEKANHFGLPTIALPPGTSSYLTKRDLEVIAWGVEEVRNILSSPPLQLHTGEEAYPGPSVIDDALRNHIQFNHLPNSHWVGSAKMGADDDPMAVVDSELRVRGVQGLRIVDASVIPHVPNGNTHSTVCVVASRGAHLIAASRRGTTSMP